MSANRKFRKQPIVLALSLAFIAGSGVIRPAQAQAPGTPPNSPSNSAPVQQGVPEVDYTWPILRFVLQAELMAREGNAAQASEMFLELGRRLRDTRLMKRAVDAALAANDLSRALVAAQAWSAASPNDEAPNRLLESLQIHAGEPEKIESLLERRLSAARSSNQVGELYNQLRSVFLRASDKKRALEVLDRLSAKDLSDINARLLRADLAFAGDDIERALMETAAARAIDPKSERATLSEAQILSRDPGRLPQLISLLDGFVQQNPKAQGVRLTLARQLLVAGRYPEAKTQLEAIQKDNKNDPSIILALAQAAYQSKAKQQAREYLERYIALPEQQVKDKGGAYLFLSDLSEEEKNLDEAMQWAKKVPTDSEQSFAAQMRQAVLLGKQKRTSESLALLNEMKPRDKAQGQRLVATKAIIQRNAGQHKASFDTLFAGLQEHPEESDLLYDLGMAAEKVNNMDVMEASFRKLIKLRPESGHAYNALGYSLADRKLKIDEAYELIKKAISLMPADSHVVDSLGWVYFRKGNHPKALEFLRKSFAISPDADVAAHLGEVLWVTGKRDEARKMWRDALAKQPDNDTLQETLKRFKLSKP